MPDQIDTETQAEQPAAGGATPESTEQVVDQQQAQVPQSPESDTGTNDEVSEAPKDNAAWAAMRVENKRLKEAIQGVDPSYLESLRGAVRTQEYPNQQVPQVTGDADYSQVTQNVNWASQQAAYARQEMAKLQRQLELQQDREAERAFPELKSDKVFQQIVAEKKLAARVLGHDRTTYEIAEEVSKLLGRREEQIVAKATQSTKEQILQRQAISSEPKGTTTGGRSVASDEDLRMRVRKGDQQAQDEIAKKLIADLDF